MDKMQKTQYHQSRFSKHHATALCLSPCSILMSTFTHQSLLSQSRRNLCRSSTMEQDLLLTQLSLVGLASLVLLFHFCLYLSAFLTLFKTFYSVVVVFIKCFFLDKRFVPFTSNASSSSSFSHSSSSANLEMCAFQRP